VTHKHCNEQLTMNNEELLKANDGQQATDDEKTRVRSCKYTLDNS